MFCGSSFYGILFFLLSVDAQANNTQVHKNAGFLGSLKEFFTLVKSPSPNILEKKELILKGDKANSLVSALSQESDPIDKKTIQDKGLSPPKESANTLLSHIATYKITLDKNFAGEDIEDANGFMTIKIWDTGDGWVFEQNSSLIIYSTSGEGEQVNTNVASWQDYAGNHYRFNSRTLRNGQIEDVIRGEAHKGAGTDSGKVIYHLPNTLEINIPNETVFPLHHLLNAVQKAARGDLAFSTAVFDGSAEIQEAVMVDTVISYPKESKLTLISETKLPASLNKVWSMEMGIYPLNGIQQEYKIKQDVLNYGIIKSMTLDYGSFQVVAHLEKLEFFATA